MTNPTPTRRSAFVVGAGLVVAATVASSVTATAASAAPRADDAQVIGPLVTETSSFQGAARFSAPSPARTGNSIAANRAQTLAQARATAVRWYLPAPGSTTTVRPLSAPDRCLTAADRSIGNSSPVTLQPCRTGDESQRFTLAANTGSNNPIGTGLQSTYNQGFLGLFNTDDVMRLQSRTVADRIPTLDDFVGAFAATLDRVDALARTAYVSGTGTPGAKVLVNGGSPVDVRSDSTWTAQVSGLSIGANTIELTQYEGTQKTGEATLSAVVALDALTFDAAFAADRDAPAVASGRAHPGATVSLFGADGRQIGSSVVSDPVTGAWKTPIPAPDAGGSLRITAAQFADGVRDTAHEVTRTLDYGAAVTVTTPADGAAHDGGALSMDGGGEPGSAIEIHEVTGGGDRVIGSATVLPNERWSAVTEPLDRSEHVLRAVQKSRGANTTIAEVTVNPGQTGRLAPVTLTTPSSVTPGVVNTFTGTAEPDATYVVLNVSDNQIVPGTLTVGPDGNWTFDRAIDWRAQSFQFKIRQTKDGITEDSELFTIAANAGFDPVTVTNRTVLPGEVNTFTGTGPKGATFEVLNASGKPIVPGTHDIDGDGDWSFDRAVSVGELKFSFKLRITIDGSTYTTKLFELPANTF